MLHNPQEKYRPFQSGLQLSDRTWPNQTITHAPRWCSTDMRDGNQALANPMDAARKLKFFQLLVHCGFKEIEVAFPAASETDFQLVRTLINDNHIPDDVNIQVITQARHDLIERTFESLQGAKQATIHLYNATAEVFRRLVFNMNQDEVIQLACNATAHIKKLCQQHPNTQWTLQYSPETFCFTEPDFALRICEAVADTWQASAENKMIINLPTTVEVTLPNVFADQIEWFCRHFSHRKNVCLSIHPHNDRGTGVATAEMAILAGAQRIEGCLFGNGERTGNVDLVNLALNLYTQGISPNLDFSNIKHVAEIVSECNELPIHPRHPYVGELVFTAFSGSHQDAIKKGFAARSTQKHPYWEVPYLPIDPQDLGCQYEAVIRVNSQSGKSGAAWVLQQNHGIQLPPALQRHFSQVVQQHTEQQGQEVAIGTIWQIFCQQYGIQNMSHNQLVSYQIKNQKECQKDEQNPCHIDLKINQQDNTHTLQGHGNGLLSASLNALNQQQNTNFNITEYSEHTLGKDQNSRSIAYVCCANSQGQYWGVAIHDDVASASIQALLNATSQAS